MSNFDIREYLAKGGLSKMLNESLKKQPKKELTLEQRVKKSLPIYLNLLKQTGVKTVTESMLRDITQMAILLEKKGKKKEEDTEEEVDLEDVDLDIEAGEEAAPESLPAVTPETSVDDLQSTIKQAYDGAVSTGDEKLINLTTNLYKYFTNTHVLGAEPTGKDSDFELEVDESLLKEGDNLQEGYVEELDERIQQLETQLMELEESGNEDAPEYYELLDELNTLRELKKNKFSKKKVHEVSYSNTIDIEEDSNGNLVLTIDPETAQELRDDESVYDIGGALEYTHTTGNTEYMYVDDMGYAGFGLTSAPGFATSGQSEDEIFDETSRIWWFPNYAIEDPYETLLDTGKVVFLSGDKTDRTRTHLDEWGGEVDLTHRYEPDEVNDAFITSNGNTISVTASGEFLGEFEEEDEAIQVLKDWMEDNSYWPTVWYVDDHGGIQEYDIWEDGNVEQPIDEKTSPKAEKIVKGMKKNKSDFVKRYGRKAEDVMYATAQKMSKK